MLNGKKTIEYVIVIVYHQYLQHLRHSHRAILVALYRVAINEPLYHQQFVVLAHRRWPMWNDASFHTVQHLRLRVLFLCVRWSVGFVIHHYLNVEELNSIIQFRLSNSLSRRKWNFMAINTGVSNNQAETATSKTVRAAIRRATFFECLVLC